MIGYDSILRLSYPVSPEIRKPQTEELKGEYECYR